MHTAATTLPLSRWTALATDDPLRAREHLSVRAPLACMARAEATPAPHCVRAAEDYIDEHLAECIALDDLLAAAGTSARTLQTAFARHRGTTPMGYLRDRRLDLARAEIRRRPDARVTEIAVACGFGHLGRFARQYRARFGEAPSDTRRRR